MSVRCGFFVLVMTWLAAGIAPGLRAASSPDPIRIGILHALTGRDAASERPLVDAALLAVEEINAAGGVLGRPLQAYLVDASDPATFGSLADQLIADDHVAAIFGCGSAEARRAVEPVVEKRKHLLWYPMPFEGGPRAERVIYGGAAPEQLLAPTLDWCFERFGKRLFAVGADDPFAHAMGALAKAKVGEVHGTLIDEVYLKPGDSDVRAIAQQIRDTDPDAVIAALPGDATGALFRELAAAGVGAHQVPVVSLTLGEEALTAIGPELATGHYAARPYFQSVATDANRKFVAAFQRRYGLDRVLDAGMETMYTLVYLFARAVQKAGSTDVEAIRTAAAGMAWDAPSGAVTLDPVTRQLSRTARIGQVQKDGQFKIVLGPK